MTVEAYPLHWPEGQPRTPLSRQSKSRFSSGNGERAQREMLNEIRLLGGTQTIVSSNVPVRRDGLPYADAARRKMTDAGVAVYFHLKGEQKCVACDRWQTPWENIRAIGMTIAALRGIARWGSSDMVDRAFRGYAALPAPGAMAMGRHWSSVLEVDQTASIEEVTTAYRKLAMKNHPDNGGSTDAMAEINAAFDAAKKEKGV